MLNTPTAQIFISYSHTDSDFVNRLTADLRAHGLSVWVDTRKLRGGQIWVNELQNAIDSCQVLLLVLSPDAVNSLWVQREYQYALSIQKRVIPILLHPIPHKPLGLSNTRSINFQRSAQRGLGDLLRALSREPALQIRLDAEGAIETKRAPTITRSLAVITLGVITPAALGYIGFLMGGFFSPGTGNNDRWNIATVNGTILGACIGILLLITETGARRKNTLTPSVLIVDALAWAAIVATFYAIVAAHPFGSGDLLPLGIAAIIGGTIGVAIQFSKKAARKNQALSSFTRIGTVIFDGFLGMIGAIFIINLLTNFTGAYVPPAALLGFIAGLLAGGIIEYTQQA